MEMQKMGRRNVIFTQDMSGWILNLHIILGEKFTYIIDTGPGRESAELIRACPGAGDKPVFVVNTHHHWDHVWGNHCFSDCQIISHRLCRELMEKNWSAMAEKNRAYLKGEVQMSLPGLLFEDAFYFPDDGIRLFHSPGHTPDSISVYDEKDRFLNVGDNIGDLGDELAPGLEVAPSVYKTTIAKYQELDVHTCLSGHNIPMGADVFEKILGELDALEKE